MNILFLVSSFLVILSFVCAQTFHSVVSFESEKTFFIGYMKGLRRTRNMWQQKIFSDAKKFVSSPTQGTLVKKEKPLKNFDSHRKQRTPSHYSKLNISHLFTEQPPSTVLHQTALSLMKQLYGDKPFIKKSGIENFEQQILAKMIKLGKKTPLVSSLKDLSPSEEPLKLIYYRMLKGSGDYDLEKKQGYPPLSDFFSLEENERKPIYFSFASYPLLSALFGKDIAEEIVKKEEEKSLKALARRTLTKQEVEEMLIRKMGPKGNSLEIVDLLSFSKKNIKLEKLTYKDPISGVYFALPLTDVNH